MTGIGPYNKPTKAKVTLAFVGLLYTSKSGWAVGSAGCRLSLKTLETGVDSFMGGAYIRTVNTENPALYAIVSQHWAHAEQVRWTLLYNFLMASTILLLAWATIFAGSDSSKTKTAVLFILCLAGLALSLVWLALGRRGTGFVQMYASLGKDLEPDDQKIVVTPFRRAEQHRARIKGLAALISTSKVLVIVPGIFALMYAVLAVLSLSQ